VAITSGSRHHYRFAATRIWSVISSWSRSYLFCWSWSENTWTHGWQVQVWSIILVSFVAFTLKGTGTVVNAHFQAEDCFVVRQTEPPDE